jgi:amino acid adenylation domain-containing protein
MIEMNHFTFSVPDPVYIRMMELSNKTPSKVLVLLAVQWMLQEHATNGEENFLICADPSGKMGKEADRRRAHYRLEKGLSIRQLIIGVARTVKTIIDGEVHQLTLSVGGDAVAVKKAPARISISLQAMDNGQRGTDFTEAGCDLLFSFALSATGLQGTVAYNGNLYEAVHIRLLAERFEEAGRSFIDVDTLAASVRVISTYEHHLIRQFSGRQISFELTRTVYHYLEDNAKKIPHTVAIEYEGSCLTYGELNRRVNRLAHLLVEKGSGRNTPIGLSLDRSPDILAAILAIWKSGAAYIPLDHRDPPDRLALILKDAGIKLLITRSSLFGDIRAVYPRIAMLDHIICIDKLPDVRKHQQWFNTFHTAFRLEGNASQGISAGLVFRYGELVMPAEEIIRKAGQISAAIRHWPINRIGIWLRDPLYRIIACLVAGHLKKPLSMLGHASGQHLQTTEMTGVDIILSESAFADAVDLLFRDGRIKYYLLLDDYDSSGSVRQQQVKQVWDIVAGRPEMDINDYGWNNSYTHQKFSEEEMLEYIGNFRDKLLPLLDRNNRVLEVGCGHGLVLFELAPLVKQYVATDLTEVIIGRNIKRAEEQGLKNVSFHALAACDIDKTGESGFDRVVCSSVIHYFPNMLYLEEVIVKMMGLLADEGVIYLDDIMDLDRKKDLVDSVNEFRSLNPQSKGKTNWEFDLFVPRSFFSDLQKRYPWIDRIEISDKLGRIKNELTRFRYDVVIRVDKRGRNEEKTPSFPQRRQLMRKDWERDDNGADLILPEAQGPAAATLTDGEEMEHYPDGDLCLPFAGENIAYIIYTSGSTGKPKGAIIEHQGMMNHIFSKIEDLKIGRQDILAQIASPTFDISVWQMFTSIVAAAKLVIFSDARIYNVPLLIEGTNASCISIMEVVPSYLSALLHSSVEWKPGLRYLLVTGEEVRSLLVEQTREKYPWLKMVNAYGPTEASDDITHFFIGSGEPVPERIPVGAPLPNCRVYIIDRDFHLCSVGSEGEICVAGICVGRGYLNEVEKTHDTFVRHSFTGDEPGAVYLTGDLGKWLHDGNIEFSGRKDLQVKISGHRIEPGEIESCLSRYPAIKDVAVTDIADDAGNRSLYAFYESEEDIPAQQLKSYVSGQLPAFMIPRSFRRLPVLPKNANGKIDRKALSRAGSSESYLRFLTKEELDIRTRTGKPVPSARKATNELEDVFIGEEERDRILHTYNRPAFHGEETFLDLFRDSVRKFPHHIAVSRMNVHLSYSELDRLSDVLAGKLNGLGVSAGTVVAVCQERTAESIIVLLGVLKSRGVYLFVEPGYPAERVRFMLEDACVTIVITTADLQLQLFEPLGLPLAFLMAGPPDPADGDIVRSSSGHILQDLAYIMYTSGSSGRPKGVMVEQGNLSGTLQVLAAGYQLTPTDSLLLVSSLSFDVSIGDIGAALISGARIIVCTDHDLLHMSRLYTLVSAHRITVIDSVPSLMINLIRYAIENRLPVDCLRLLVVGGDIFREADFYAMRACLDKQIKIINNYGPTEATIYASSYEPMVTAGKPSGYSLPIGRPYANSNFYILSGTDQLLPTGFEGELAIGGSGVARGYMNNVELTHERFITTQFDKTGQNRLYKTGDRVRWGTEGNVDFLGRADQQVKINGYRIELLEIERVLAAHESIRQAVVAAIDTEDLGKVLVAFVVCGERLLTEEIREYLAGTLPFHMIPSHFIQLEEIPLTNNGKTDRAKLGRIGLPDITGAVYEAPRNRYDEILTGLWSEILRIDKRKISINSDFFAMGATSLETIILISGIKEKFKVNIQPNLIFSKTILKTIADSIAEAEYSNAIDNEYFIINERQRMKDRTIFLFPPLAAYGFIYMNLRKFFSDHSLYAFNFIEETDRVGKYVQLIRDRQKEGPYILLGYSAPGEMMIQIAAQLERDGAVVKLIFVDCARTSKYDGYFLERNKKDLHDALSVQKEILKVHSLSAFESRVLKKVNAYFDYLNCPMELSPIRSDIHLITSTDRKEDMKKMAGEIVARIAANGDSGLHAGELVSYMNWEHLSSGRYSVHQGFGRHDEMLSGEAVEMNMGLISQLVATF